MKLQYKDQYKIKEFTIKLAFGSKRDYRIYEIFDENNNFLDEITISYDSRLDIDMFIKNGLKQFIFEEKNIIDILNLYLK